MAGKRYYVEVTDRAGNAYLDVARDYPTALCLAGQARLHGDRADVLVSTWQNGRWTDAILESALPENERESVPCLHPCSTFRTRPILLSSLHDIAPDKVATSPANACRNGYEWASAWDRIAKNRA